MAQMIVTLEEGKMRDLLKDIMLELLEERPEIFHDLLLEALEDTGLLNAILEGESSEAVSRREVEAILEGLA